ncbi:MAG TPA: hypothetical protein PK718_01450, partial [Candidatus Methanofastidiosa archaeon]|nr:hypothetical protein [Candidatus Methanofastidiosa archaeon]
PSYSFDVTSTEMSREVLPGTTTNFTFKLMNMGNLSDTYDLSATSSLPSGWTYKLSKESVTLEEDGQITIGVSIVVPEDAPGSIEGTVNLEIMSRGNRDTEAMNFNVSTVEEQNKFVLLEVFTYIGCPYCPYAEKAAEDLLINYPGRIVVLEYHGMGDSFETAFSSERGSKYAVGGYPSAMIDGNRKVKGGNSNTYNEYVSFVEPLLDDEPLVRIQATVSDSTLSPGEKDINVIIKPQGLDSYTSVNVIFVTFRNGLSLPNHASNVYNYVVVDGFESRISLLNKTEDVTITMDIPEDGGVVIIVQDADTKKVYQSIVV